MAWFIRTLQVNIDKTKLVNRVKNELCPPTIIIGSCPGFYLPKIHTEQSSDSQLSWKIRDHQWVHTPLCMKSLYTRLGGSRVPHQHEISRDHALSSPSLVYRMII